MKDQYQMFGILGEKIGYSLSPLIYNTLFRELKISSIYNRFDLPQSDLKKFVDSVRFLNIGGFNVTIPHKQSLVRYLDSLDPLARKIQSVNMVLNHNGRLIGYNTDYQGLAYSIKHGLKCNIHGGKVMIIGSRGTATTAAFYALKNGARSVRIYHRSAGRLRTFRRLTHSFPRRNKMRNHVYERQISDSACDLCINCTPASITTLLSQDAIGSSVRILELRYGNYPLLHGKHLRGNLMLAVQAAANFKLMTGRSVSVKRILAIIDEALQA